MATRLFSIGTCDRLFRSVCHPMAAISAIRFEVMKRSSNPQPVIVKLKNAESSLYVDPTDPGISRDLYIWRQREYHATQILRTYYRTGDTVLEIGANIGYFAVIGAERVGPTGHIYAIEPSPSNVALLTRSIKFNGFGQFVNIEQAAMGDQTGIGTLLLSNSSNLHTIKQSLESDGDDGFRRSISVPMYTVDDYVAKKAIDASRVNMIRMDVEGYETKVFAGMERTVSKARDLVIFVEIHPWLIKQNEGEKGYQSFLERIDAYGLELMSCVQNVKGRLDVPLALNGVGDLAQVNDAVGVFLRKRQ